MAHILIVDSDLGIHAQVKQALSRDGHQVMAATAAHRALQAIEVAIPDLLIVDAAPGDNLALCRRLRNAPATARLPILCLTAELSAAAALDAGSDDYLRKPFAALELAARVRALDRRARRRPPARALTLDPATHAALVNERRIQLTVTEYELLAALEKAPGIYVSAAELLHRVWGYPVGVGDAALVRNHIRHLRCKLETDPAHPEMLLSQYKRGYALAINA
ncbi:MAG: response regulator transcription factor [Aggregatilineales bacterium]